MTAQAVQALLDESFPSAVNVRIIFPDDPDGAAEVDFVAACISVIGGTDEAPRLRFGSMLNDGKVYDLTGELKQVQSEPFARFEFKPEGVRYYVWMWSCPLRAMSKAELTKVKQNTRDTALRMLKAAS